MLKILGCICIAAGCLGIGFSLLSDFKRRLWHMEYMKKICMRAESEIRYYHASMPDTCKRIALDLIEPYQSFFFCIASRMEENKGQTFYGIWEEECKSLFLKLPLSEEEFTLFREFFVRGMNSDLILQQEAIRNQMESFEESVCRLKKDLEVKGKMYTSLGLISGLLLIIILI